MGGELRQGLDSLSGALDINRICPVVIVFWPSRRLEKGLREVPKPAIHMWSERLIAGAIDITLDTVEVVSSMETIDPVVAGVLTVVPGAVGQLVAVITTSASGISRSRSPNGTAWPSQTSASILAFDKVRVVTTNRAAPASFRY